MHFAHPGWLVLLVLVPMPLFMERARPRILWSSLAAFPKSRSLRHAARFLPPLLRGLAIGALAIAMARPQSVGGVTRIVSHGLAIVVVLDQSSSMKTVDFPADYNTRKISRLDAAKITFARFVEGRPDDLIGLVVFANLPDRTCVPTLEHQFLLDHARAIRPAKPGDDGTNIGDALALALAEVRKTNTMKQVLVLLTDGNNEPAVPNPMPPEEAAELCRELGVTLHTIAIGRAGGIVRGTRPGTDLPTMAEVEGPNIPLLEELARRTGGRWFVATSADALAEVFRTIDTLEKSLVQSEIHTRYDEHFPPWAISALVLLVLDRLLVAGWLRRVP
jgi:Ca-activated chloride channel family protein